MSPLSDNHNKKWDIGFAKKERKRERKMKKKKKKEKERKIERNAQKNKRIKSGNQKMCVKILCLF